MTSTFSFGETWVSVSLMSGSEPQVLVFCLAIESELENGGRKQSVH